MAIPGHGTASRTIPSFGQVGPQGSDREWRREQMSRRIRAGLLAVVVVASVAAVPAAGGAADAGGKSGNRAILRAIL